MNWIGELKNNFNVVVVNVDEISVFRFGKINVVFSGVWNKDVIWEVLGENMGVVVYLKVDFGSG